MSNVSFLVRMVGGVKAGITALAGGARPTLAANTLSGAVNVVETVATDNDSVVLPSDRVTGDIIFIFNDDAAQDIKVYGPSGGTINGAADTTALIVGQQQGVIAVCASDDGLTWWLMLTSAATPA